MCLCVCRVVSCVSVCVILWGCWIKCGNLNMLSYMLGFHGEGIDGIDKYRYINVKILHISLLCQTLQSFCLGQGNQKFFKSPHLVESLCKDFNHSPHPTPPPPHTHLFVYLKVLLPSGILNSLTGQSFSYFTHFF